MVFTDMALLNTTSWLHMICHILAETNVTVPLLLAEMWNIENNLPSTNLWFKT
jgi:hypothetical protein